MISRSVLWSLAALVASTSSGVCQDPHQALLERAYRFGIVKIEVTTARPVFRGEEDICQSQGTGFVLDRNTVMTAEHVVTLAPECGPPIIAVRSALLRFERLATRRAGKDDAVLLATTEPLPKEACSLRIRSTDVYNQFGFRFGIPGRMQFPTAFPVKTGYERDDFSPLVQLTPNAVEKGDSGGPVVVLYNVVGVMRVRHATMPAFSAMTPGKTLRELLAEAPVMADPYACNPALLHVSGEGANTEAVFQLNSSFPAEFQAQLQRNLTAAIRRDDVLAMPVDGRPPTISVTPHSGSVTIGVTWGSNPGRAPPSQQTINASFASILLREERAAWERLVEEGRNRGLWRGVPEPLPATPPR